MLCVGCFTLLSPGLRCKCEFDPAADVPANVLQPGASLVSPEGKRYRIGMVLGTGTFAIAYLAWQEIDERRVAIKEFLPREIAYRERGSSVVRAFGGDGSEAFTRGIAGFVNEAKALNEFDHPNVVTVEDFFEANSTAYLVMPYTDCVALGDYLEVHSEDANDKGLVVARVLDVDVAVRVVVAVLDGLSHVHNTTMNGRRWLHRDVKPSNILLRSDMSPLLIDFGAARIEVSNRGRSRSILFTPGYAPIEQHLGERSQGPWVDVYACAATLYQAITGRIPEDATDRADALANDESDPLIAPNVLRPDIGSDISAAVMHGLAVDHRLRPQNADEFRRLLIGELSADEFAERVEVNHKQEVGPERAQPGTLTQPALNGRSKFLILVGVVGLLALGVSCLSLYQQVDKLRAVQASLMQENAQIAEARIELQAKLNQETGIRKELESRLNDVKTSAARTAEALKAEGLAAAERAERAERLAADRAEAKDRAESDRRAAVQVAAEMKAGRDAAEKEALRQKRRAAAEGFLAGRPLAISSDLTSDPLRSIEVTLAAKDGQAQVTALRFWIDHGRADSSAEYQAIKAGKQFGIYFSITNSTNNQTVTTAVNGWWQNKDANASNVRGYNDPEPKVTFTSIPCNAEAIVDGSCKLGAWITVRDGASPRGRMVQLSTQLDK